ENVAPVDAHGSYPGQVVESDLVDEDFLRRDAEQSREGALEADRHVAETYCAVAGVEERPGHDPDRIREVDDPCAVARVGPHALGDLQHDRDRAQRFREAAGTRGLLADAPAGEGKGLVLEARCLAPHADLDEDEVGAVYRAVEIVRDLDATVVALLVEHPLRHAAHGLAPIGVDILQPELAEVEPVAVPGESGNELGRVGRAAADDRELHTRIWLGIKTRVLYDAGIEPVNSGRYRGIQLTSFT